MADADAALTRRGGLRRTARWIAMSAALMAAMSGFAGLSLLDLREDSMAEARRSTANLVSALDQAMSQTIGTYDASLKALAAALALPGIDDVSAPIRAAALIPGTATAPFLGTLVATDAHGRVIVSREAHAQVGDDLSDQALFRRLRDHPDPGLVISQSDQDRAPDATLIALARRRSNPDGSFAGIVAGSLRVAYFTDMARRFRLGDGAVISLLEPGGTQLARLPPAPRSGHKPVGIFADYIMGHSEGQFEDVSQVDGQRRLYAFAHLEGAPLVVVVGITTSAIYADWGRRARIIGPILLLLGILGVVLLILLASLRQELTRRRAAERDARKSDALYRVMAEHSNDAVTCLDPAGISLYVSPAIEDQLGYPPEHFLGRPFLARVHPDDRDSVSQALDALRADGERTTISYRCLHRDGYVVWLETSLRQLRHPQTGAAEETVGSTRDVTLRKHSEEQLTSEARELALLAATDPLTGLGNRRRFDQVLHSEWMRARREASPLSLLMLDVDWFKPYNDTYGHPAGDDALCAVARIIREHVRRPADFAARYGGEEFAVVLPATEVEGAVLVAENIRRALTAMSIEHIGSPSGRVTVSVGVATTVIEGEGTSLNLVGAADAALYEAKRQGRDRTEIFGAGTAPLRSLSEQT